MLHIPTVLRERKSVGPFSFFDDDELEALAPAIDTLAADVVARREPQCQLVHDYICEVGHRSNERYRQGRAASKELLSALAKEI